MRLEPSPLIRWLLVLVISIGVVAMHSVVSVGACSGHGGEHSMSREGAPAHTGTGPFSGAHHTGRPGPEGHPGTVVASAPSDGQDAGGCSAMGHLCLAILTALGLILILGLITMAALGRRRTDATVNDALVRAARSPPAGPPPNRASLTELCVSRR